jgi:hypothetical protein
MTIDQKIPGGSEFIYAQKVWKPIQQKSPPLIGEGLLLSS